MRFEAEMAATVQLVIFWIVKLIVFVTNGSDEPVASIFRVDYRGSKFSRNVGNLV
jgi:hypothetical protein